MASSKPKCVFCNNDNICGCHSDEPLYDTQYEHPQFDIDLSDTEFEEVLDELDKE